MDDKNRNFLFLQGPHGPFFAQLSQELRQRGASTQRIGFNAGDRLFWRDRSSYIPYRGTYEHWPQMFKTIARERRITDVVLYGDARPVHRSIKATAQRMGIRLHVFEEGYLRPYWVSYERNGSNGNSPLMNMTLDQILNAARDSDPQLIDAPANWGDMRQHIFYGAVYHWSILFVNQNYQNFRSHRPQPLRQEALGYTRRLLLMPYIAIERELASWRVLSRKAPYHIVLLQLAHDANFREHGPFQDMEGFMQEVIEGFAKGAPTDHRLVFKAHPLDTGETPYRRILRRAMADHGLRGRLHFVNGGKLASLLDNARSAITINSTAAHQALFRGLPLKVFGSAIYAKPELVSRQPIEEFFANPAKPDQRRYLQFRQFLLASSQLPGGFYSRKGRSQLLPHAAQAMWRASDPYDAAFKDDPAMQHPT